MESLHDTDTDSDFDNEINSINNDKIYEPKELNDLLLDETKQIANNYQKLSLIGDIINFKKWKRSGCSIDITMNDNKIPCKVWEKNGLKPDDIKKYLDIKTFVESRRLARELHSVVTSFVGHRF